jgi:hypothetical protein
MSPEKELSFFLSKCKQPLQWYETIFESGKAFKVRGEFSPFYMLNPDIPRQIHQLIPDARIIFILRDPVRRAYSHYLHAIAMGEWSSTVGFSEAIRSAQGREEFLKAGFYAKYLRLYLDTFGAQNVHIMFTEMLSQQPAQEMAKCYTFLGVDPTYRPNTAQKHNVTRSRKGPLVFRRAVLNFEQWLRPKLWWVPKSLRDGAIVPLRNALFSAPSSTAVSPMAEADKAYLQRVYQDDMAQLAQWLKLPPEWNFSGLD